MKIPLKSIAAPFLLSAAIVTQLVTPIYAMDFSTSDGPEAEAPVARLPHEILAASTFISLGAVDHECQGIAGKFLGKTQEMARKIEKLGIPALEAEWRDALRAIKTTADVDDDFNLLGDVPAEAATFLTELRDGKKKKALWEIACLRSQTYQREAAEANMLFEFFGQATTPLSMLVALRDAIITKDMLTSTEAVPMHGGQYYGYPQPPRVDTKDTPALAFIAGLGGDSIYLDFDNFQRRLPATANQADILLSLRDLPARIQKSQVQINDWLKAFPNIWEITLKILGQAQIQQSMLTAIEPSADETFKDVDAHRRKLLAASQIVAEKEGILNVMRPLKEFLDKTKGYLRKNSKIT
jgi:hypothetical protein